MPQNFENRLKRLEVEQVNDYSTLSDAELVSRIKQIDCQLRSLGVALPAWPSDNDLTPEYIDTVSDACAVFQQA